MTISFIVIAVKNIPDESALLTPVNVSSSLMLSTMMVEMRSSETSVLTRASRRHIPAGAHFTLPNTLNFTYIWSILTSYVSFIAILKVSLPLPLMEQALAVIHTSQN
jgi:hypothetical protein